MSSIAPVNPAFILQARTDNTAQSMRMALSVAVAADMAVGATSPNGGVHPAFGGLLNVTGTAGMSVNVDTGLVYIPSTTAWEGSYAGWNTASYAVTIPASNATQWRMDYIAAVQNDSATSTSYGGVTTGADGWDIVNVEGTFSGSAPGVLPALPPNAISLATIAITPNMTVTTGLGTVTDARSWVSLPGVIPCTSSTRPALSAPEGTLFYESDTHMPGIIINGAYQYLYPIPGQATVEDTWHNLSSLVNSWTSNGALPLNGYRRPPYDPTQMEIILNVNAGVTTDGTTIVNLPAPYRVSANYQRLPVSTDIESAGWTSPRSDGASPYVRFTTTGDVVVYGLPHGSGNIYVAGRVRLT